MARTFNGTNQQGTSNDTSLPTGSDPCTLFCRAKITTIGPGYPVLFGYGERALTKWRGIGISRGGADDGLLYSSQYGSAVFGSSTDQDDSTWRMFSADFSGTTSNVYVNGVSDGSGTMTHATALIGASGVTFMSSGGGDYIPGDGAEFAIWSVVLDASEHAALGKGFSPMLIRPASLVRYWKFLGNDSPEVQTIGPYTASLANSPAKASHPRVIYPRRKQVVVASAAAAATTFGFLRDNAGVGAMGGGPFSRANAGLGVLA